MQKDTTANIENENWGGPPEPDDRDYRPSADLAIHTEIPEDVKEMLRGTHMNIAYFNANQLLSICELQNSGMAKDPYKRLKHLRNAQGYIAMEVNLSQDALSDQQVK